MDELTRSYQWLELINPAETFGDIVIDYPHVEWTSAAIRALTSFKKLYPEHMRHEIENSIFKAAKFIEDIQASDGSWYGSRGVCFTYGGWFGIKGLIAAGNRYSNYQCICKSCTLPFIQQRWIQGCSMGNQPESRYRWEEWVLQLFSRELISPGLLPIRTLLWHCCLEWGYAWVIFYESLAFNKVEWGYWWLRACES